MNVNRNILFITHYSDLYGANLSMIKLILELKNIYKISPFVLVPSDGPLVELLIQNNINFTISHYYWWVNENHGIFQYVLNIRKQFLNLFRVFKIVKKLKCQKFDLIYSNSITINIGFFISKFLKIPHIWHLRESMKTYNFKYSLGNYFSKLLISNAADKFIVVSKFLHKEYENIIPKNKTNLVYNGIEACKNPRNINFLNDYLEIALVGIICEQKNQLDAINALEILKRKGLTKIRLHLVGGSKKEYKNLVKLKIAEYQLQDQVILHGHVDKINLILENVNIGLTTSIGEAFGRSSIEYMLHRLPVLVSNSGANTELIYNGENGFIYELFSSEQLANYIQYFYDNPVELERIGSWGQNFAELHFSSSKNTKAIHCVIQEIFSVINPKEKHN